MADSPDLADLSAMSDKAELLAELRELQVPSVSSWPAPGWWILLFLVIASVGTLWMRKRRIAQRQANAWREEALIQLNQLNQKLNQASESERHSVLRDTSVLLRKVMIYVNGRQEVAGLTDQAWLDALEGHGTIKALDPELQVLITEAPYQSSPSPMMSESNVKALLDWIKRYVNALPQVPTHDQ